MIRGVVLVIKQKYLLYSIILIFCLIVSLCPVGIVAAQQGYVDPNDQAIAEWTQTIDDNPNDAVAYYKRAKAYLHKVQYDKAISDFDKAIEINSKYTVAYLDRGFVYQKRGQDDKAIIDYSHAIASDPNYVLAYTNRAYLYNRKGKYDLAINDCNKAIEINPKSTKAYFNKGTAYEKKHLYQEAVNTYRILLVNVSPQDIQSIENAKDRIRALGETV